MQGRGLCYGLAATVADVVVELTRKLCLLLVVAAAFGVTAGILPKSPGKSQYGATTPTAAGALSTYNPPRARLGVLRHVRQWEWGGEREIVQAKSFNLRFWHPPGAWTMRVVGSFGHARMLTSEKDMPDRVSHEGRATPAGVRHLVPTAGEGGGRGSSLCCEE